MNHLQTNIAPPRSSCPGCRVLCHLTAQPCGLPHRKRLSRTKVTALRPVGWISVPCTKHSEDQVGLVIERLTVHDQNVLPDVSEAGEHNCFKVSAYMQFDDVLKHHASQLWSRQGSGNGRSAPSCPDSAGQHQTHNEANHSTSSPSRGGGVKRISAGVYDEVRGALYTFLRGVVADSIVYTDHGKRKTVTSLDVIYALKRRGRTLYGYGP
ncbi:hypothetical protein CF326_g7895 [Tilletia indica]|nr:hypothetical protein CF326_g7895 [Tilletia indica]